MANEHGLFWNSQNGDRVYDANDFSEWLKKFYTTGVFNGDLEVTAAGGMTVSVSSGYVNIEGKVKFFSTPTTLTLATASGTYGRIDTVVAECNYTDREIKLKVVTGAYSVSPKATAPVRTAAAYQLVLAQIDVAAGAAEITQKNITDKRMDSNVCGLVTGTVSQIDFSTVKAQFDSWFEDVKGTLDSDAAGNLKNQIDAANEKIETNASAISDNQAAINTLNSSLTNKLTAYNDSNSEAHMALNKFNAVLALVNNEAWMTFNISWISLQFRIGPEHVYVRMKYGNSPWSSFSQIDAAENLKNQIDAANEKIETNASAISDNQTAINTLNSSLTNKLTGNAKRITFSGTTDANGNISVEALDGGEYQIVSALVLNRRDTYVIPWRQSGSPYRWSLCVFSAGTHSAITKTAMDFYVAAIKFD